MRFLWARMATLGASWGLHEGLLVILIKVSCLTSLMRLHGGFKGGLMKPPGGCMKLHVGFMGGAHEASWGLMKLHGGFMGTL